MGDVRRLAAVCTASLVLAALMMVPGLLGQPTIANGQLNNNTPNMVCSANGILGCFSCGGTQGGVSGTQGCSAMKNYPAGWTPGNCVAVNGNTTCSDKVFNCGTWIDCKTKAGTGGNCTTLGLCK